MQLPRSFRIRSREASLLPSRQRGKTGCGLVVVDTSYDYATLRDRGQFASVTCRDLGGFFCHVWTIHPVATAAHRSGVPWHEPARSYRLSEVHTFIEASQERFSLPAALPFSRAANLLASQLSLVRTVWELTADHGVRVVRAGDPLYSGIFAYGLSRILGVPLTVRIPSNNRRWRLDQGKPVMPRLLRYPWLEERIERFVLSRADAVLAANQDHLEFAVASGARRDRTVVIRYGNLIDKAHFTEPSSRRALGQELLRAEGVDISSPVLMHVGRLEPLKRADHVLLMAKSLLEEGLQFQCVLVGEGSEQDKLQRLIDAWELGECVRLLGARSQEWLSKALPAATIFLSPMTGRALTEAGLAGLPVVAYDVDWQSELIENGVSGLLAPLDDVKGLASCVAQHLHHLEEAHRMGAELRKRTMEIMDPVKIDDLERAVYQALVVSP